jgi:hypothetical protein
MEYIYSNQENKNNTIIGTNNSYDKFLKQSPKIRNNKFRPLTGRQRNLTLLDDNINIKNRNFIAKGTNFSKQLMRLSNEELINIIGPINKKAGNINKNKKNTLKNFLKEKNLKTNYDKNKEEIKNDIHDNENNKVKKLKIEIKDSNLIKNEKTKDRKKFENKTEYNRTIFNKNISSHIRQKRDKYLPKGYLEYEQRLLNNNNSNKERIYYIKERKQKANESDILFLKPRSEKESINYINKEKARTFTIKLGSDIFNSKNDLNNLMKSSELYLFKRHNKQFSTESNSFWASKVSTPSYMNYPSVEYNILNPTKKNNTKTKEKIYKETLDKKLMNPIYKQKSISTFYDITKVGTNRNLTYQKTIEENNKIFYKNNDVCTIQYNNYKNYEGLISKPFLTQINKNIYC